MTAQASAPGPPTASRSEVKALLDSYRALLEGAGERSVRRLRLWRLAAGLDRFLVERVRLGLDTLERHYSLRAAAGRDESADEQDDRHRVREFALSLPPRASASRLLWLLAPLLVLTKILLGWLVPKVLGSFRDLTFEGAEARVPTGDLQVALDSLTTLDYTSAGRTFDLLFREGIVVSSCVLFSLCAAGYIVLRPLASGLSLSRAMRDPRAAGRLHFRAAEVRQLAERLDVREREREAFGQMSLEPPGEPRFDLLARALLPVALLFAAAGIWKASLDGVLAANYTAGSAGAHTHTVTEIERPRPMLLFAFGLACLAAMQIGWLAFHFFHRPRPRSSLLAAHIKPSAKRHVHRRRRVAPFAWAGLAVIAVAAAFGGFASRAHKSPSITVRLSAPITAAMARERQFTVDVWCDKPCNLSDAALIETESPFSLARLKQAHLDYEDLYAYEPELRSDPEEPRQRVRLYLTPQQAKWLEHQLEPELELGAGFAFTVGLGPACPVGDCIAQYTLATIFRDLSCPETAVCVG